MWGFPKAYWEPRLHFIQGDKWNPWEWEGDWTTSRVKANDTNKDTTVGQWYATLRKHSEEQSRTGELMMLGKSETSSKSHLWTAVKWCLICCFWGPSDLHFGARKAHEDITIGGSVCWFGQTQRSAGELARPLYFLQQNLPFCRSEMIAILLLLISLARLWWSSRAIWYLKAQVL